MAAALRSRSGFNGTSLKFVKGKWQLGRDELDAANTRLVARPDWAMHGWVKWSDKKLVDLRIGYVADNFVPPERSALGDLDQEQWALWSNSRDPWNLQWHLPLYNQVSGAELVWSTDTVGGKSALGALLHAYADRIDAGEAKSLPIVELGSSTYPHMSYGPVHVPQLDIVGWVEPPPTVRPALPAASPPALERRRTPEPEPEPEDPVSTAAEIDDGILF
jgi:hypothetical protein